MPSGWYQLLPSAWSKMYVSPCFIAMTGLATSPHSANLKYPVGPANGSTVAVYLHVSGMVLVS